jgi:transketolase
VAWRTIIERVKGPVCLVLSRQAVPLLDRSALAPASGLSRGGYVLAGAELDPDAVIVATGSEVAIALGARELLRASGIAARVVSMPSLELFAAQPPGYRELVISPGVPSVSVEAGVAQGWEGWVDASVSTECFGASAPGAEMLRRLGITPEAVAETVRTALGWA